ncbi:MAG: hypothetical protein BMS9Abin12_1606 [Acidimicrobiia bacterium]|nr:MAG: hypothetical protein BMS9Abin12_1606 [Acidimicrobiia bacterium]
MNGRTISLTIVAFLIGALAAAGIGVRVIEEVRADEDAASSPENVSSTTLPPAVYYVDPDETLIGSTVLVSNDVRDVNGMLAIEYDLISIAPTGPDASSGSGKTRAIFPREWRIETVGGTISGGPSSRNVTIARFEFPTGVGIDGITSVSIIDPLVAFPFDVTFELSQENASVEILDGVVIELVRTRTEGDGGLGYTIVQLAVKEVDSIAMSFTIEGVGPEWLPTSLTNDGHEVGGLPWLGGPIAKVMTFRARGVRWVEFVGSFPVSIDSSK